MDKHPKSETTIYWAPAYQARDLYDLNHLYAEPKSVYEELVVKKAPLKDNSSDFLRCPATSGLLKNTFVVRAPVDSNVSINFSMRRTKEIDESWANAHTHKIKYDFLHQPTLSGHNLINYVHPVVFFSEEESMVATLTPPYFERVSSYQSGTIVPGRFDVAKWFRPMNMEFQLWPGVEALNIPMGEAICYVHFDTDKKVVLRRFVTNHEIEKLIGSFVNVSPFRKFAKLSERYKIFEQSRSKQRVLKLIQKQLI
jgi:hypothetical protein